MATIRHRTVIIAAFAIALTFVSNSVPIVTAQNLPEQINDETFWSMVSEFSEPGGYFRSDNFVSNETTFQQVIPRLKENTRPGGVYLGVGPDQNFTYIVALKPKIAFIVDIRRQNMLEHLMYKAVIELSANRVEFLSRLFSRPMPPELNIDASPAVLFEAFRTSSKSQQQYDNNLQAILDRLVKHHGFKLTDEDQKVVEYVYNAFYIAGLDLTYSFSQYGGGGRGMPTYSELMMETDGVDQNRSYMASEENFQILKQLEEKNLVIPLVGDFAGPKALRSVGRYLRERNATVTALYTSNVEQYLFQSQEDWSKFYLNVASLPSDSSSTFIRAIFNNQGLGIPSRGFDRTATLLCPIEDLVEAFTSGRIALYEDVILMSK